MLYLQLKKLLPKNSLTVVEMQELPDIERTDSREEASCLKWTIYNCRREVCVNCQTDTDELNVVMNRLPKQSVPQRY